MRSLWTAATGMKAQQFNIDTISHNLSNVNTTGFKRVHAEFQDLFYTNIRRLNQLDENRRPVNLEVGHGVMPVATKRDFRSYSLMDTDNIYDMALMGDGFFSVMTPNGERYTRDGSFKLSVNEDGTVTLVTSDGNFVLSEEGEQITFDPKQGEFKVTADGTIRLQPTGKGDEMDVAKLKLVKFPNPQALNPEGQNLFSSTVNSGEEVLLTPENSTTQVTQGRLEMSNVQIVDEMVRMITAQRAYEINSKAITTSDEMLQTANGLKR